MESFDLKKLCKDYYRNFDQHDSRNSEPADMNLDQVKLRVVDGSIKWTDTSPVAISEGPTRKLRVNNTSGADVFGNVQTSKDNNLVTRVSLTTGLVKGLNKKMKLPLPPQVRTSLGENVEIDPASPTSESVDKMTVSMTSGHDIAPGAAAAQATVRCKTGEYQGKFKCQVSVKGPVIYRDRDGSPVEINITEVLRSLSGFEHRNTWTMQGHCEFQWDYEQTIDWS